MMKDEGETATLESITEIPMASYEDIAGNKKLSDFEKSILIAYGLSKCSHFAAPTFIRPFSDSIFAFPAHNLFLDTDECMAFCRDLEDEDAGRLYAPDLVEWADSAPVFEPAGDNLYVKEPDMPDEFWHFVKLAITGAMYAQAKQTPVMICKEGCKTLPKKAAMPAIIRKVWNDVLNRADIPM